MSGDGSREQSDGGHSGGGEAGDYGAYVARFTRLVGDIREGQYGRFRNRLIPRLPESKFNAKFKEYLALGQCLSDMMMGGDTMDEGLVLEMRAAEAELVLEASLFLPSPRRG